MGTFTYGGCEKPLCRCGIISAGHHCSWRHRWGPSGILFFQRWRESTRGGETERLAGGRCSMDERKDGRKTLRGLLLLSTGRGTRYRRHLSSQPKGQARLCFPNKSSCISHLFASSTACPLAQMNLHFAHIYVLESDSNT